MPAVVGDEGRGPTAGAPGKRRGGGAAAGLSGGGGPATSSGGGAAAVRVAERAKGRRAGGRGGAQPWSVRRLLSED